MPPRIGTTLLTIFISFPAFCLTHPTRPRHKSLPYLCSWIHVPTSTTRSVIFPVTIGRNIWGLHISAAKVAELTDIQSESRSPLCSLDASAERFPAPVLHLWVLQTRCNSPKLDYLWVFMSSAHYRVCGPHNPLDPLAGLHGCLKFHSASRKDDLMNSTVLPTGKIIMGGVSDFMVWTVLWWSPWCCPTHWYGLILCANLTGHGTSILNIISWILSMRVFLDEMSIWIGDLVNRRPFPMWVASSNPVEGPKGTKEEKGWILPLFPNSFLEIEHFSPFSPSTTKIHTPRPPSGSHAYTLGQNYIIGFPGITPLGQEIVEFLSLHKEGTKFFKVNLLHICIYTYIL